MHLVSESDLSWQSCHIAVQKIELVTTEKRNIILMWNITFIREQQQWQIQYLVLAEVAKEVEKPMKPNWLSDMLYKTTK